MSTETAASSGDLPVVSAVPVGPALNEVPDNATIAFFLYDIVTATDGAGNPTKRSNFEFFYTLSRQAKSEDAPLTVKKVGLSQELYEVLIQRAGGPNGGWVSMPELDRIYDRK